MLPSLGAKTGAGPKELPDSEETGVPRKKRLLQEEMRPHKQGGEQKRGGLQEVRHVGGENEGAKATANCMGGPNPHSVRNTIAEGGESVRGPSSLAEKTEKHSEVIKRKRRRTTLGVRTCELDSGHQRQAVVGKGLKCRPDLYAGIRKSSAWDPRRKRTPKGGWEVVRNPYLRAIELGYW